MKVKSICKEEQPADQEEVAYRMGEHLCQLCRQQRINIYNIQKNETSRKQKIQSKMGYRSEQGIFKRKKMTHKHFKKCSAPLAIREIEI